jgi:hypothetical protein
MTTKNENKSDGKREKLPGSQKSQYNMYGNASENFW